jgi:hypothetical protein
MDNLMNDVREQHAKIVEQVSHHIREFTSTGNNQTFYEAAMNNMYDFIDAINWREDKWLQALLVFHVVFAIVIIYTRKRTTFHAIFLMLICK